MRLHFSTSQWLPYPPELVFAFFANPENLPRLMPRWQRARIEEAHIVAPASRPAGEPRYPGVAAGNGTRLVIGARPLPLLPVYVPWEALIEDFRWNEGFCDVQVKGPFRYWRHCHTVRASPSPKSSTRDSAVGGSVVLDEVEYELPLGGLGTLANAVATRPALRYVFRYRQKRAAELLELMTGRKA
jgi:ligand-binding SRPBCC domain-containing protein